MKLSNEHAREFTRILEQPELKPLGLQPDGNFKFGFKSATADNELVVDPGMVAGLIQLKKSVERGQSSEDLLVKQIAAIVKELGLK